MIVKHRDNSLQFVFFTAFLFCLYSQCFLSKAHALMAEVPETGQTISYGTGDDGALKPGIARPIPRFTANGNGTATDNLTGLIWLQNANCTATIGGVANANGLLTWADALTWSNALASGNCSLTDNSSAADWRLPNRFELESLVDLSKFSPVLQNGHPFINVKNYQYWSSSTYLSQRISAWTVNMNLGEAMAKYKDTSRYVWPVRGGQFGNSVLSVSPSSGNYGNVAVSGSSLQTITISNSAAGGSSRLQINAIALRGTDPGQFSINPGNGSGGTCGSTTPILNPGVSCTVSVSFSPTSAGARSATLRVSGSDVNAPNTDIPLTGTGGAFYNVTGSVSGGNGTISSTNPASVASGNTATFTLAPSATYQPASSVTGSCPAGSWNGNQYTTGTITTDCTVGFSFTKITYPLTINYYGAGTGTISVEPKPPAIDCTGTCSQSFDAGTLVTLYMPTFDAPNIFSGWQGCPETFGDCTISMSGAKSVSALFNATTGTKVKMNGNEYGVIVGFYDSVPDGGEISLKAGDFYEVVDFVILNNKSLVLKGGYNTDFSAITGISIIHGPVTLRTGTVIFDNIVIM